MEAAGKRYIIHGSRLSEFTLWHFSDLHLMNRGCAEGRIKKDVETVRKDPYAFWLGGGDYVDFIGYQDKRFDPDAVAEDVTVKELGDLGRVGMTKARDLFAPIKDKGLGLLLGNHEKKYALHTEHESLHGWLCEELGLPNLQYCAFFDLVFCRKGGVKKPRLETRVEPGSARTQFRVFAHHGAGYATTPGGKLNKLITAMNSFDADLYFLGHVHDKIARREPAIGANAGCTELEQRDRLGMIAGSYLKTYERGYTSYGEQRMYRPVSLGAAVARIVPETRTLSAEV